ncbi:vWA domain-containing protein [Haloarcula amylovorans]|uniref:vWA domain-containing protein n=1 Tax=Haloarcula amylovorans TaxID=2562280 RepID=UPI00143103E4|nr:VWA domain-containing protein [Halomicroarcula amylolytica]
MSGKNGDYGLGEVPPQIKRVPNLFLLDTSGSMRKETTDSQGQKRRKIDQLNDGLELFNDEIGGDFEAREGVDVSVVTFGGGVNAEQEFQPIKTAWVEGSGPPKLSAGGMTPMCEAIVKGLENLNAYKDSVDQNNLGRHRALVWLLTDGRPDNTSGSDWDAAQQSIESFTQNETILFFGVGIGDEADIATLNDLVAGCPDNATDVFQLEEGKFDKFFELASNSATQASKGGSEDSASDYSQKNKDSSN